MRKRTTQTRSKRRLNDAGPTNVGLGVFFAGSSSRRLILAFAIAIAFHEVAAGLVPGGLANRAPHAEIVTDARIVHVSVRRTPRPEPQPTPRPQPRITPTPIPSPLHIQRRAPSASAPHARLSTIAATRSARPVWDLANGRAISAMSVTGSGTSVDAGLGAATQTRGNGGEASTGSEPCGFVTFSDPHGSRYDPKTRGFWVDIRMSVHFSDGTSQSTILDYPWYYPSEASNPWSDQNRKDPNFPTRFQPPPADKAGSEPLLVQYVVAHSTSDGMTLLRDCPS